MAVGKNKQTASKKAKGVKKASDPFARKEWYDVKAPQVFPKRHIGKTVVTKTIGTRTAKEGLLGRVFNIHLGELKDTEDNFTKFRLKVEDVQGRHCLTNFHGMEMASDKLRSLVRKWHTLIEASTEVKTTDGYVLRLFCIGLTKSLSNQKRKSSYAQHAQVKTIRRKMIQVMQRESSNVDLQGLVQKLITDAVNKEIDRVTQGVYPLTNIYVRKVKVLRGPKIDVSKLLEIHGGASAAQAAAASVATADGVKVDRPEEVADKKGDKKKAEKKDDKKAEKKDDKPAAAEKKAEKKEEKPAAAEKKAEKKADKPADKKDKKK